MYPHCDSRILHRPSKCKYCALHPLLHLERLRENIAYSGEAPKPGQKPCPADQAVANGERGDYNEWPGNTPEGYQW